MQNRVPSYRKFLASDNEIRELLRDHRSVALIGINDDPMHPAVSAAKGLQSYGYRIVPVHPTLERWEGIAVSPSIEAISPAVEIVVIFDLTEVSRSLVAKAVAVGARVFWLDRDVVDAETAYFAHRRGLYVVMNRNILVEYEMHFPDDELGYGE